MTGVSYLIRSALKQFHINTLLENVHSKQSN